MSRGQRVLQEINLIRAALGQQGNRLQKQAKQAVRLLGLIDRALNN